MKCKDADHSALMRDQDNPRFIHGRWNSPYRGGWTQRRKEEVRERDRRCCRLCSKSDAENGKALDVHHIDYDKNNAALGNLIALCQRCHSRMHGGVASRREWTRTLLSLLNGSSEPSQLSIISD
jgi:5-methylcytosine-specific restriction endonuclease McrA